MSEKRYVFPSLSREGIAYTLHVSSMDLWKQTRHTDRPLSSHAGFFQCYNDGLCQHSPECAVSGADPEVFADYCASFAAWALSTPWDEELTHALRWIFLRHEGRAALEFALSVKHDEKRTRYYNPRERKVSSRESLRYDKRWLKVEEWMKGDVDSALRVLTQDGCDSMIERFTLREALRDVYCEDGKNWDRGTVRALWGDDYRDDRVNARQAHMALQEVCKAVSLLEAARSTMECYRSNKGLNKKPDATEDAA